MFVRESLYFSFIYLGQLCWVKYYELAVFFFWQFLYVIPFSSGLQVFSLRNLLIGLWGFPCMRESFFFYLLYLKFSVCLILDSFIIMYQWKSLGLTFCCYLLALWTCMSKSLPVFRKFSAIIYFNKLFTPSSSILLLGLQWCYIVSLSHVPLVL